MIQYYYKGEGNPKVVYALKYYDHEDKTWVLKKFVRKEKNRELPNGIKYVQLGSAERGRKSFVDARGDSLKKKHGTIINNLSTPRQ